jgi:hypothetical protein
MGRTSSMIILAQNVSNLVLYPSQDMMTMAKKQKYDDCPKKEEHLHQRSFDRTVDLVR